MSRLNVTFGSNLRGPTGETRSHGRRGNCCGTIPGSRTGNEGFCVWKMDLSARLPPPALLQQLLRGCSAGRDSRELRSMTRHERSRTTLHPGFIKAAGSCLHPPAGAPRTHEGPRQADGRCHSTLSGLWRSGGERSWGTSEGGGE